MRVYVRKPLLAVARRLLLRRDRLPAGARLAQGAQLQGARATGLVRNAGVASEGCGVHHCPARPAV